jgi:geranylgeranylglycerol-phosphate geranylgeranyltransferase
MSLFGTVKDHILIGGPNAVSGWGLLVLLAFSGGLSAGILKSSVNLTLYSAVLIAAFLTGNGTYALNAYFDKEADKINKPNRPIPSGRMTPQHALKYAYCLMALGLAISIVVSIIYTNTMMFVFWSVFTLLGIAYSMPPLKLKGRHLLGNLCFGTFAGLSFYMNSLYNQTPITSSWLMQATSYIIVLALYIGGLVTMKDLYDVEGDEKIGDYTLPVKVGREKAAMIAIVMIAMVVPIFYKMSPPANLSDWLLRNSLIWGTWIYIGSFIVYIALDYVGKEHVLSNSYARVIYYYVIISAAYGFVKGAVLPWKNYPLLAAFINSVANDPLSPYDRFVELAIYMVIATAVILQSRKIGRDILRPKVNGMSGAL